jgi:hypothetical protein
MVNCSGKELTGAALSAEFAEEGAFQVEAGTCFTFARLGRWGTVISRMAIWADKVPARQVAAININTYFLNMAILFEVNCKCPNLRPGPPKTRKIPCKNPCKALKGVLQTTIGSGAVRCKKFIPQKGVYNLSPTQSNHSEIWTLFRVVRLAFSGNRFIFATHLNALKINLK